MSRPLDAYTVLVVAERIRRDGPHVGRFAGRRQWDLMAKMLRRDAESKAQWLESAVTALSERLFKAAKK